MAADIVRQNAVLITLLVFGLLGVICYLFFRFSRDKLKMVREIDMNYKEYDGQTGHVIKEGHPRNIWDYSSFPGISRVVHKMEWQTALALVLLFILFLLYFYTKERVLLDLVEINFGIMVGTLIKK